MPLREEAGGIAAPVEELGGGLCPELVHCLGKPSKAWDIAVIVQAEDTLPCLTALVRVTTSYYYERHAAFRPLGVEIYEAVVNKAIRREAHIHGRHDQTVLEFQGANVCMVKKAYHG